MRQRVTLYIISPALNQNTHLALIRSRYCPNSNNRFLLLTHEGENSMDIFRLNFKWDAEYDYFAFGLAFLVLLDGVVCVCAAGGGGSRESHYKKSYDATYFKAPPL